jgi:hypothetical protein
MSYQGRWTVFLGSVLAAIILGTWGCCSVPCDPAGQLIVVKEKETKDAYQLITISKGRHQQIVWQLSSGSSWTSVAITLGEHPAPFVNCVTTGGVCEIACEHRLCYSGSIDPTLPVPPSITYEYQFRGPGGAVSTDPGIRIDP